MRKLLILVSIIACAALAHAQGGNTLTIRFAGAPSGPCSPFMLGVNNATSGEYNCTSGGAWNLIGGGGGSGTVTSVSFTGGLISVANPTTTPAFTVAGTSGGIPFFDSASTWSTSAALTANRLVLGGGAGVAPGILGSLGTTTTVLHGNAAGAPSFASVTSGDIDSTIQPTASPTFTGTATLPTVTNTGAFTNSFAGASSTPGVTVSGAPFTGGSATTNFPQLYINAGTAPTTWATTGTAFGINLPNASTANFVDFHLNGGTSLFKVGSGGSITASGSLSIGAITGGNSTFGSLTASTYNSTVNCSNGASPAVCSSAAAGSVAVPTGTNPTLTINTTRVTANSQIFLQIDESATISATTCNTTLSTLVQPVVTARTAATSFTIQIGAVIASNPACVHYFIMN